MKKLLTMILAAATATTLFAGCSGGGTAPSSSAAPEASQPQSQQESSQAQPSQADGAGDAGGAENVTLKWALWDWDSTAYYKPLIEAYTAQHPNVTVEYVDLGSSDYQTMLQTQLTGGADDLDVLTVKDIPGYSNLVRAGHLEPLDTFISEKNIDTSLYGGTTEQILVDGKLYAIPFRSDFWVLYYNKDLFDKAGVPYPTNDITLDQYDEMARKLTSGTGAEKVYGAHYHTWRSAIQLFSILDGQHTVLDGNYDFMKPYYERILKEQQDGICQDYAALKTSSTHYSGVFYNNQVATMNMGSWFIATQIEKVKSGESLAANWGIVKYPHPDGVAPGTTLGTITSLGVNAKSKNKEAALDFVNFVCGSEGAQVIAKTGTIPAIHSDEVVDIIASVDGFPTDPESKEALKTAKVYLEMPMHEKAPEIEVILNQAHDDIMTGNESLDDAVATMNEEISALTGA